MLDAAGVAYEALPPMVDEAPMKDALLAEGVDARGIADALAELKALKLSRKHPTALVLGGDSTVSVEERMFDKPVSREDAAEHLAFFSGKRMELYSGAVIAQGGAAVWRHVEKALLHVRPLSEAFIADYLDAEWPAVASSVGCFRIEARGVQLFDRIQGDQFTIYGMPLVPILGYLRERGEILA